MSAFSVQNIIIQDSVNAVNSNSAQVQTLSGAGTIDLNVPITSVTQTGTAYTVTLPEPQYIGQIKTVMLGSVVGTGYRPIAISYNWSYYEDPTNVSTINLEYLGDNQVFIGASIGWSPYNYIYD